ncbi:MAG: hypothetical protein IJU75_06195 [Clostridia bacterium]|nr:hypothetical protein [Clostridia bacterium]
MMPDNKKVLIIGGGGTLGEYTTLELLTQGCRVDVIALENLCSFSSDLRYIRGRADDEMLSELLGANQYQGVIDFLHYPSHEAYEKRMRLLANNTERYIFLSSYRVYADSSSIITENSPQISEVYSDSDLLKYDTYGMSKCRCEKILSGSEYENWTIVRPLISFSRHRFDLVTLGGLHIFPAYLTGRPLLLPVEAKNKTAGLGWAGNVGKLIARLLFAKGAERECFTVGNDENLTWSAIADIYSDVMDLKYEWVDSETYLRVCTSNKPADRIILYYDRLFDRRIDNSKVMGITGTQKSEMLGFRDALIRELQALSAHPEDADAFIKTPTAERIGRQIDEYWSTKR